jgi:uncharacterized RDD family membrane protein YckC
MNTGTLEHAGRGIRFINMIVDMIAFFIIWLLISIVLIKLGLDQTNVDSSGESVPVIPMIIIIPVFWFYYILTEYTFQQTLGKLLTKTKVSTKSGDKPSILQILGRTLSRSIPFEYISYLFSANGIHDSLSGTTVIKK